MSVAISYKIGVIFFFFFVKNNRRDKIRLGEAETVVGDRALRATRASANRYRTVAGCRGTRSYGIA